VAVGGIWVAVAVGGNGVGVAVGVGGTGVAVRETAVAVGDGTGVAVAVGAAVAEGSGTIGVSGSLPPIGWHAAANVETSSSARRIFTAFMGELLSLTDRRV